MDRYSIFSLASIILAIFSFVSILWATFILLTTDPYTQPRFHGSLPSMQFEVFVVVGVVFIVANFFLFLCAGMTQALIDIARNARSKE
jgi:hypothetical protein